MTTYILHGGYYKRNTLNNINFFKEISNRLEDWANILFVAYAREKSDWENRKDMVQKQVSEIITDKRINLILASDNKDIFIEQIKSSDAIFLSGWQPSVLYNYLKKIPNLKELWEWKLVIWSSAWVWVLSRYYCLWQEDRVCKWLDILPIKTLVHWEENQTKKYELLKEYGEDLEIYKIPEEEYIII